MLKKLFATFLVAFAATTVASAQPEFFASPEACITAPAGSFTYYAPKFDSGVAGWLKKLKAGKAEVVKNPGEVCVEEWTSEVGKADFRIVRWRNVDSFREDGKEVDSRCANEVRRKWPVPKPAALPTKEVVEEPKRTPPSVKLEPPPPACVVTGDRNAGYSVLVLYGTVVPQQGQQGSSTFIPPPENLPPGKYSIHFAVKGAGGETVECSRSLEVLSLQPFSFNFVGERDQHRPWWGYVPCIWVWTADLPHDWNNAWVVSERLGCVAGGIIGAKVALTGHLVKHGAWAAGSGVLP